MSSNFKPEVHLYPYEAKNGHGVPCEWIELHTYKPDSLAFVTVHGSDTNNEERTVDLWLTPDQVRAIRDGFTQILDGALEKRQ